MLELLRDPAEGRRLALAGRELVQRRFLLPRLIGDELRLYSDLLEQHPAPPWTPTAAGITGEDRDPVCGMRLHRDAEHQLSHGGER